VVNFLKGLNKTAYSWHKQQALKQLKNTENTVTCVLQADKGHVTAVKEKKDYLDKKDALVNEKQTYPYQSY